MQALRQHYCLISVKDKNEKNGANTNNLDVSGDPLVEL
jgi:hypothetical protein